MKLNMANVTGYLRELAFVFTLNIVLHLFYLYFTLVEEQKYLK